MPKIRTQLYLDKKQRKVLEEAADRTGKSLGQLVREAVDQVYGKRKPERALTGDDPIWRFVGCGESGSKEISTRHDEHLYP